MARKETAEYEIKLQDNLTNPLNKANKGARRLDGSMSKVGKSTGGFGSILKGNLVAAGIGGLVAGAAMLAKEAITIGAEFEAMQNAIKLTSGTAAEFEANMKFLKQTSSQLGLDLMSATTGFKTLAASAMGTSLQGEGVRHVFQSVASATAQLGISAEDSKGAFLALGQMISKGKVSAEELRGQLGERLPGAFNIAADAMGVTTMELDKMLQNGEIISEQFLPKFAKALNEKFGDPMTTNVQTMQANMNRLKNVFTQGMANAGQWFAPVINGLSTVVTFFQTQMENIKQVFAPLTELFTEVAAEFSTLFDGVGEGLTVTSVLESLFNGIGYALRFMMPAIKAVVRGWMVTFKAIVKVSTAIYQWFQRTESVKKGFKGFVASMVAGFVLIKETATNILSGVGDLLAGIFSGNIDQIKKGLSGLKNSFSMGGSKAAKAFNESYSTETQDFFKNGGKKEEMTGAGGSLDDFIKNQKVTPLAPSKGGAKAKKESSTSVSGVSSGRPTAINIDIGKLIENFTIETTNLEDMEIQIKNAVAGALVSAVNDVNLISR